MSADWAYNGSMERVNKKALEACFATMGRSCRVLEVRELGSGAHGTGYLIRVEEEGQERAYVLKSVAAEGLGHDYPSDRAGMHLLALETFNGLPRHVRALDVLSLMPGGDLKPIGGGTEYYLLMERALGTDYFHDLESMKEKKALDDQDRERISLLVRELAGIHTMRSDSRSLYLRRLRDIVGHGECLMGVFDNYPEGTWDTQEMEAIERECVEWRYRLRNKQYRLCRVHGDYHPGNLWFAEGEDGTVSLTLLDRSRGPWGEPADDVTALTINYVFYSILSFDGMHAPYDEALELFYEEYLRLTRDHELTEVVAPFYAVRGAVVANPVFYPRVTPEQRGMIFQFVRSVLAQPRFKPGDVGRYLQKSK
jgi:hypothetical protein